jgi:hypothetical protein
MGKRKETKKAITDIMNADAKDGLYAREHYSPTIQELLDETTPEELEKINKEMSQTAVDFFYDEVWACFSSKLSWSECEHLKKIKEQAKEIEKEQKNKMPIHIHEGISNTWFYIEDGVFHVKPNDLEMVKQCQFEIDNSTSSATKCKWCGRDKWEHIKYGDTK